MDNSIPSVSICMGKSIKMKRVKEWLNAYRPCDKICFRGATVREKILENEKKFRSGKSESFIFRQGNLEKMKKVVEKSGNFKIFNKSCYLTGFWKSYIRKGLFLNINCKQFMFRNIPFLNLWFEIFL